MLGSTSIDQFFAGSCCHEKAITFLASGRMVPGPIQYPILTRQAIRTNITTHTVQIASAFRSSNLPRGVGMSAGFAGAANHR